MKKSFLLLSFLFLVPQQKATTDAQNIAITAVVSTIVSCGTILGIPKLYEMYHQTALKKEGDQLYDQLATQYASEIAAHEQQQLTKNAFLEIIQNNNHSNDSHPVRLYSQSLNINIERLQRAQYFEKNKEAQQLIGKLQQIRILKNNHLQKDYEAAQKSFLEQQFDNEIKNIELEKLNFEKEAARQHCQNEQKARDILDNVKIEFKDMLVKMEQQTNAVPTFIAFIGQRLQQIETKIEDIQKNQDAQNNDEIKRELKKLIKEVKNIKQKQIENNAILGVVSSKINASQQYEDPEFANASAPSYADLYEE